MDEKDYKDAKGYQTLRDFKPTKDLPELLNIINSLDSQKDRDLIIQYFNQVPEFAKNISDIDKTNAEAMLKSLEVDANNQKALESASEKFINALTSKMDEMSPDDPQYIELAKMIDNRIDKDQAHDIKNKEFIFSMNKLKQYGGIALMFSVPLAIGIAFKDKGPELINMLTNVTKRIK